MSRLLAPLPALIAAVAAVGLAWLWIRDKHGLAVVIVVAAGALVGVVYLIGRAVFRKHPVGGGWMMEAGLGLLTIGSAVAGGFLVWLAIDKADAKTPAKEAWAALSAAAAAYLGAVIIKPEGTVSNPVKSAIKRTFANDFNRERANEQNKRRIGDGWSAVHRDGYGAEDEQRHADEVVDGWGWSARRTRTRHIADAL